MRGTILRKAIAAPVYDVATETPLEYDPILSERYGFRLWLKREDRQAVRSFKLRGAYAKMAALGDEGRKNGVVCASAGNHAQGVAMAASRFGCAATIVMPRTTPELKVDAVRRWGATAVLHGDDFDAASAYAKTLPGAFVHPFDDIDVIAGQATIGLELIRQFDGAPDAVYVPVGGGGLAAGVVAVLKEVRPEIRVIGVEAEGSACLVAALMNGGPTTLDRVSRFADGVAVRRIGDVTYPILRENLDDVVTVGDDAICAAIKDVFEGRRAILEPAGSLAVAGAKAHAAKGSNVVAMTCGANIDFDTLRYVSERAEIGERREAVFGVVIPEVPGAFRRFCAELGPRPVTEFNYRLGDPQQAAVFVGLRVRDDAERHALRDELGRDYEVFDFTEDEIAKLHVRHMVGGKAPAADERLIAFEFPERAGALLHFLNSMDHPWNVSLFHYRNHGGDVGRVLAGIQVPPADTGEFAAYLGRLGFAYEDVTANAAMRLFL